MFQTFSPSSRLKRGSRQGSPGGASLETRSRDSRVMALPGVDIRTIAAEVWGGAGDGSGGGAILMLNLRSKLRQPIVAGVGVVLPADMLSSRLDLANEMVGLLGIQADAKALLTDKAMIECHEVLAMLDEESQGLLEPHLNLQHASLSTIGGSFGARLAERGLCTDVFGLSGNRKDRERLGHMVQAWQIHRELVKLDEIGLSHEFAEFLKICRVHEATRVHEVPRNLSIVDAPRVHEVPQQTEYPVGPSVAALYCSVTTRVELGSAAASAGPIPRALPGPRVELGSAAASAGAHSQGSSAAASAGPIPRRAPARSSPSVPPLSFGRDGGLAVMSTTGGVWAQPANTETDSEECHWWNSSEQWWNCHSSEGQAASTTAMMMAGCIGAAGAAASAAGAVAGAARRRRWQVLQGDLSCTPTVGASAA